MLANSDIENCQLLDQGTEERLQQMRKRLHREAERTWHGTFALYT